MLDGKMLRGLTGTPMRRIALANSSLADAEPEPLTLANLTTKSLPACSGATAGLIAPASPTAPPSRRNAPGSSGLPGLRIAAATARLRLLQQEFLHVPGSGRAAFRAQAAVQAHILVLHHDPVRVQRR